MEKLNILITGGAGFQGSHLTEYLLKKGHKVSILNTPSKEAKRNLSYVADAIDVFPEVVWGSVTDYEVVYKTMRDKDLVFHLASRINTDESLVDVRPFLEVNVYGTFNVLEAAKKVKTNVIFTSTCEVYGQSEEPSREGLTINKKAIVEEINLNPHSPYAATKCAADRLCFAYFKSFGLPIVIIRPFNLFGERQKEGGYGAVVPIFVRKALGKIPLLVHGDGKQTRDFLYISDMVNGYEVVMNNFDSLVGQAINIASSKKTSINRIAKYIANYFKVPIKHVRDRPAQIREFTADIRKASKFGFKPRVSLVEGLNKYIKWRSSV